MPLSLLDRTDSLPDDMFARVGASIAVPANQSSHSNIAQQSQAPQVLSSAYGYSYALPYYNDPKDASPSQAHMDGTEAYQPPLGTYPAYGSNMSTQPYGYTSLPTMPPRYSMTGTPFVPPNRGCISPLDLFTTSSAPSFTVSAPHTGIASTFDHSARNTSGYMSNSLAFSSTPFTPDLSLPASGPPSAHLVPSSSSPTSFGLGLAVPETPIGSDSAPDTNIESPISDSEDDELEETKEEDAEEDDDMQVEPMASPKVNVGKLKIKLNKAKGGSKKDAEADDAEQGTVAVKKRSRTAQACEKCRVRKARCFGGNPCHRCTKRGFSCEFTPSRVRVAAPRAEIKPKTRRHSMHVVGASGPSHMVSGQPGVNGIIASPVPHAPLSRVQSHNHVYGNGQPRATPYSRPPISHSHSLSTGVHLPLLSPAFGVSAHMGPADMTGSQANLVMYGNPHAHTQPISQIPLPRSPVGASGLYNAAFHTIPSFEQMHPTGSNRAMQPNSVANTSSLTPAFSSSSLELSLGTALPVASQGLGLGLSIDNDEYYNFNSSPSDRSSDVPALSGSSTSSNNSGDALSTFASSGAWSSLLETSGLPSVDEDVFDFSPVQEYDGIRVVGWDDEPAGINNADPGVLTQSSSTAFSLGQQVEGVRDAAARHLYDVGSEWYGATR